MAEIKSKALHFMGGNFELPKVEKQKNHSGCEVILCSKFSVYSHFMNLISGFSFCKRVYILYIVLGMAFLCSSCSKKKIELSFTALSSGTVLDLNSIYFLNDSLGYTCGGLRYEKGEVLKTEDGGFTWTDQSTGDMIKALYKITFPSPDTGFCCGYDGKIFRTYDGGNSWILFQSALYRPLRDVFMLNSREGYACGGDGFKTGCRFSTVNSGDSWESDTSQLEFRSIIFFNDSVGVVAGYGAILRTVNGG